MLRQNQSNAEGLFWSKVRNRQLAGWKFKRQVPIGPYIVDFYVDALKAVVELDGDQHGRGGHPAKDRERDHWLHKNGYTVFRFWNIDVYERMDAVLERLAIELDELDESQR